MIRRPPRSTLSSSSAASDVYKRQELNCLERLRVQRRGKRCSSNACSRDRPKRSQHGPAEPSLHEPRLHGVAQHRPCAAPGPCSAIPSPPCPGTRTKPWLFGRHRASPRPGRDAAQPSTPCSRGHPQGHPLHPCVPSRALLNICIPPKHPLSPLVYRLTILSRRL